MFIEKIVLEKSYRAQLQRSLAGARVVAAMWTGSAPAGRSRVVVMDTRMIRQPGNSANTSFYVATFPGIRRYHSARYKLSPMFLNRAKFVVPLLVLIAGASCSPDKKA